MQWEKLSHGVEIRRFLESTLKRFLYTVVPTCACLPWVAKPGRTWVRGSGPLAKYIPELKASLSGVSDDFQRHMEAKFANKLQPRNIYHADFFDQKIWSIKWDMPNAERVLTKEMVVSVMDRMGLGKTCYLPRVTEIRPPSGITSVGVLYDDDIGQVISGAKGNIWSYAIRKAMELLEWCENMNFTWSTIDLYIEMIISKWDAIFVPGVRLDRGPEKLRLLFAGNVIFYILETMVSLGIKRDMKATPHYGYDPNAATIMQEHMRNCKIITGDFVACDLHFNAKSQKACWEAWQSVYRLPESLMCVLYVYNTFGPIAIWDQRMDEPELILKDRVGLNPSGAGAFVIIMNLYVRSILEWSVCLLKGKTQLSLETADAGISFGDDHAIPDPTGSRVGWEQIMSAFGQDVTGSEWFSNHFKFLRMLYGPSYSKVPILFSRFRNACCPEDTGILKRSPELNAIALRAQLLPFAYMKQESARWSAVYEAFSKIVASKDHLLMEQYPEDDELARSLDNADREKDELFFAKRVYQVDNSVKLLR